MMNENVVVVIDGTVTATGKRGIRTVDATGDWTTVVEANGRRDEWPTRLVRKA